MYDIANAYFMAHQPEFMLAMFIGYPAMIVVLLLLERR